MIALWQPSVTDIIASWQPILYTNYYQIFMAYSIIVIFIVQYYKHCYIFKKPLTAMMRSFSNYRRGRDRAQLVLYVNSLSSECIRKKINILISYQVSFTLNLCKDRLVSTYILCINDIPNLFLIFSVFLCHVIHL